METAVAVVAVAVADVAAEAATAIRIAAEPDLLTETTATTLDGGLRAVTERVGSASSVCLGLAMAVGSRDERPEEAGFCHFLEHLLFRGTEQTSARQISVAFDSMGGMVDAMTSRESTILTARVASEDAPAALALLLEMVSRPGLTGVDTERRVILEEMAMIEDDYADRLSEEVSLRVHGGHPLGRPIAGTRESVKAASRERLAGFHRSAYSRAGIVAFAAGEVDHQWF
ncbi:MAG: pitrilysin family protein, partial [Actinomycetes bacterium]